MHASALCLSYLNLHLAAFSTLIPVQCVFGLQVFSNFPEECLGPSGLGDGWGPGQLGGVLLPPAWVEEDQERRWLSQTEVLLPPHHPSEHPQGSGSLAPLERRRGSSCRDAPRSLLHLLSTCCGDGVGGSRQGPPQEDGVTPAIQNLMLGPTL